MCLILSEKWESFVASNLRIWEKLYLRWQKYFKGPLFVVRYEDLKDNLEKTLRDVLTFIGHPIDEELLKCTLVQNEGSFKRKARAKQFDPFTPEMKQAAQSKIDLVYAKLKIQQK
jgi:hypothetical protein